MKKLNAVIYNKLLAQAEEAKEQGMIKLSNDVLLAIGSLPNEEESKYSYGELKDDLQTNLWKMATCLIHYYDLESLDASKLNDTIIHLASNVLSTLEDELQLDPLEISDGKLMGETE